MFRFSPSRLRCSRAQEWISLAIDDQLDEAQRVALTGHLAGCEACRRHEAVLQQGRAALQASMAEPSENFEWKVQLGIQRALREGAASSVESGGVSFWRPALASAAAVALLVVGAGSVWLGGGGPAPTVDGLDAPVSARGALAVSEAPAEPDLSGGVPGRVFEMDATREGFGIRTVSRTVSDPRFTGDLYEPVRPRAEGRLGGPAGQWEGWVVHGGRLVPWSQMQHRWEIGSDGVPVLNLRLPQSTLPTVRGAFDAAAAESSTVLEGAPR